MRAYELMVIISGKLDESTAHAWIKTISASVAGVGGQIHGNPDWDQYSVITSALAGFLFQNGCQSAFVTQHYLDGLFLRP